MRPEHDLDLAAWRERPALSPIHHFLQVLDDEEHETNDPDRLYAFGEILSSERSSQLDAELVPWLLRYLWVKPYANYTQHAWRLLQAIAPVPEALAPDARAVLAHHPHGETRAEVLAFPEARYPAYLEDDAFLAIMKGLVVDDPSPRVRVAAWDFLEFSGAVGGADLDLLARTATEDPSAEVRARVCSLLGEVRIGGYGYPDEDGSLTRRRKQAQEAALADPANAWVLAPMLRAYLRTTGIHSDPGRAAFALDLLARRPDQPLRADVLRTLSWQIPWGTEEHGVVAERWIRGAPYGDGDGFLAHLVARFRDSSAAPDERVDALHALFAYKRVTRVPLQEALDLYLSPALGPAELATFADCTQLVRTLFARTNPPVHQADDRLALLELMVARTRAFDAVSDVVASSHAVRELAAEAVRLAQHPMLPTEDAQALLDAACEAVVADPGDSSFGLYDLHRLPAALGLDRLAAALPTATPAARVSIAEFVARGCAEQPSDDRLAILLHAIDGDEDGRGTQRIVRELPARSELEPDFAAPIAQSVERALDRLTLDDWVAAALRRWLD